VNRFRLLLTLFGLFCLSAGFHGAAQALLTVDATKQPSRPPRGRGPFPGSTSAGHSAGLPIRLELLVPTGELSSEGSMLADFLITNVGTETLRLPFSVHQGTENIEQPTSLLTLWLTSDAIRHQYARDQQTGRLFWIEAVATSAELYGTDGDAHAFAVLPPNASMLVHALSPQLNPGRHPITAHAELLIMSKGTSRVVGTADSETVEKTMSNVTP